MKDFQPISGTPLISVIIPCFNQAKYLEAAVGSIRGQHYDHTEIILVDDGSTDHTPQVASHLGLKSIRQDNLGLAAARNTGIRLARGALLVFLDADDLLYPNALVDNLNFFQEHPDCAFVSGSHTRIDSEGNILFTKKDPPVSGKHFLNLLRGNYIGMHAAVMYRREIFEFAHFDESLLAAEDYDLYLRITRTFPVAEHTQVIAAYRIHDQNMSADPVFMLHHVQRVLKRVRPLLLTGEERIAWKQGKRNWGQYYAEIAYRHLTSAGRITGIRGVAGNLLQVARHSPVLLVRHGMGKLGRQGRSALRGAVPGFLLQSLYRRGYFRYRNPAPGHVLLGDLNRLSPFSRDFGFDRGGPVDRYYIDRFLDQSRNWITGRVLEAGDRHYTTLYGGNRVRVSDVLHVEPGNKEATILADLSSAPQIPANSYDCIILTQTLHLIYDFRSAIGTCHRILRPGGSLLLTVPGISNLSHGGWREQWLYTFTDKSMQRVFTDMFPGGEIEVSTWGNVLTATAFLYGMGIGELDESSLATTDPDYQLIITVKAIKSTGNAS